MADKKQEDKKDDNKPISGSAQKIPAVSVSSKLNITSPSKTEANSEKPKPVTTGGTNAPNSTDKDVTATGRRKSQVRLNPDVREFEPPRSHRHIDKDNPQSMAKSRFRKVAAVLAFTRRQKDIQQLSPGIKALIVEKAKSESKKTKSFYSREDAKSLFSIDSNEGDFPDDIKTAVLDANNHNTYVVSDPMEKHFLVESTTNKLYAYFLILFAVVALQVAIACYALRHIRPIFAQKIFFYFFWDGLDNIGLQVIALLSFFVIGNMFLVCPTQRDWPRPLRKVRWFIYGFPFLLMHVNHLGYDINLMRLDDEYFPALNQSMYDSLETEDHSTLLLSQSYFQCCGVAGYEDWDLNTTGQDNTDGFPISCCIPMDVNNSCRVPIRAYTEDDTLQIWPNGCLQYERHIVNGVIMTVFTLFTAIIISMYVATFYLVKAINIILTHEIEVKLPY